VVLADLSEACYPQNLLFAKALPDPDLRYFSNSAAFDSLEKAMYVTMFQGLYFEVCGDRPSLCVFRRASTFDVMPIYF